jgi:hypothetical protein
MADRDVAQDVEWEETGELREGKRRPSVVQSVRFGRDELRLIRDAATRAGVSTGEFIRGAALARATSAFSISSMHLTVSQVFTTAGDETSSEGPMVGRMEPLTRVV